ncbi:hypothetical protein ACIBO2_13775 [Nonomuraea sp. NPDC050022]|uniref:hypothetical protein n=1 Tax=Nonomuraea sp. NPDC050022 TaxID=3364358 RepID=UPI0037AADC63
MTSWLAKLRRLFNVLGDGVEASAMVAWPSTNDFIRAGEATRRLTRTGLIARHGSWITPTANAQNWLESGKNAHLVLILHRHVRFIGELMSTLERGSTSHEELLIVARSRYGFRWESLTPVRTRTSWLRVTGMVDIFDGEVHLTEAGRALLSDLELGKPDADEGDAPAVLPSTPTAIADLLAALDDVRLHRRARAAGFYIPGQQEEAGWIETLRVLTEGAMPSITVGGLANLCCRTHGISASSASSALDTLKSIGLVARISSDRLAATGAAQAWLDTDQSVNLARIVHAHISYFGEILFDLDTVGVKPTAKGLAERSSHYGIDTAQGLPPAAVTGRLNLLLACGLVTKISQTFFKVTPLGRAFRDSVRCLTPQQLVELHEEEFASVPPTDVVEAEQIAAKIEDSAHDSGEPERLEVAVIAAFNYLGMPSRHIGGATTDSPDGEVRTGSGVHGRILAVETKTAKNGEVSEEYGRPLTLPGQRSKINAEATIYIGPGFERRLLDAVDDDLQVAVVLTSLLAEAVRRQGVTPLTPAQLGPLVDPLLRSDQRRDLLAKEWNAQQRLADLELSVAIVLHNEAQDPLTEGAWLEIKDIRRELRKLGHRADEEMIMKALHFLTSPRIAVAECAAKAGSPAEEPKYEYRATMTLGTIWRRIEAPGRQWRRSSSRNDE